MKKEIITKKGLLGLGFDLSYGELFSLTIKDVKLPEYNHITLWTRTERGLSIFIGITQGKEPQQTDTELPHIKHICELKRLFFALTGTKLKKCK